MIAKKKIAILGGGCGAMSAAFWLTDHPAWKEKYEVTIYQQGWRLGGKGATGRNPEQGQRIEEHGLHLWMGFYHNAFEMMNLCYQEWKPSPECPIQDITDAFSPHYQVSLFGLDQDEKPDLWHITYPKRPGVPWEKASSFSAWQILKEVKSWVSNKSWKTLFPPNSEEPGKAAFRGKVMGKVFAGIIRGLLIEVVPRKQKGFDYIDQWDLREWLRKHGVKSKQALNSPLIRSFYDLAFAYPDGKSGVDRGKVAAGAALKSILRMAFSYHGAPLWKMLGGMGDTIFSPLYQVLKERGVKFEFFHQVRNLNTSIDGSSINSITMRKQATVKEEYRPLISIKNMPCWPSEPRWEQLVEQEQLQTSKPDFEAFACSAFVEDFDMKKGVDFDAVVLAIPVSAHHHIAQPLMQRNTSFRDMVENSHSVATCAMQLWLKQNLEELGWKQGSTVLSSFEKPFSSWGDLTEVIDFEDWPMREKPETLAYFCDVYPEDNQLSHQERIEQLKRDTRHWMKEALPRIWPHMKDKTVAETFSHADESKDAFEQQYFRINTEPSERYILSVPGTTKYRLEPGSSGFSNLFLAGDWTRTSINGGSVEAAVESGRLAAEAIQQKN